ncbi:MAG: DUF1194 domain-containing protein [Rhizobiaceae bacterium]|nr:DUF1194 domain-containing protein [Rhizobiaceae bacterium]
MIGFELENIRVLSGLAKASLALGVLTAFIFLAEGRGEAQARECFSTALVFAVDASGSIDDREYTLQMAGLSNAIRHPEVVSAIEASGGVVLAAVVWSDSAFATSKVGWFAVNGPSDLDHFAAIIKALPRVGGGGTDLGQGIWQALDLLDDPSLCAARRVIDVSGDGKETHYPRRRHSMSVGSAQRRAQEANVVINGLAIVDDEPDLEKYYIENVATGNGSFVIVAEGFDDFGNAMKAKLLREITPVEQAQLTLDGWRY